MSEQQSPNLWAPPRPDPYAPSEADFRRPSLSTTLDREDPRGLSAAALIEQAGLARTKVGGAEVSDRDADYVVVHPGAAARDVLRLVDLVRSRVQERFNVGLERELAVW